MGTKIARFVIGIIIIAAVVVGIYFVLPGQYKNPITAVLQSATDSNYDTIVNTLKGSTIPKNKDVTFDKAMIAGTANPAWTIEKVSVDDAGNGTYKVYADGYKCTVTFENETNSDGMVTHTNAHIRLIFDVTKNGNEITIDKKTVTVGKEAKPTSIEVDTTVYNKDDKSTYYQKTLDFLAGFGQGQ